MKHHASAYLALISAASLLATGATTSAQCMQTKFMASDAHSGAEFGVSVASDGDVIAIGSHHHSPPAVYIYRDNGYGWDEDIIYTPNDGPWDSFGYSVALLGDTLFVSASKANSSRGAVYVYQFTSGAWQPTQTLTANDGQNGDHFGCSIDCQDGRIIVGANSDGGGPSAAYIFREDASGWIEEAILTPPAPPVTDKFGSIVRIDGHIAAVTAHLDDEYGSDAGAVHVFRRSGVTWTHEAKLVPADVAANDKFGTALDLAGSLIIVGSHWDDDAGNDAGSAYIYRHSVIDGWVQEQKLLPAGLQPGDEFGNAAAIRHDMALVSVGFDDFAGYQTGSIMAYRYDGGLWEEVTNLVPPDAQGGMLFGSRISLCGNEAVITAFRDPDAGALAGSAYLWRLDNYNCCPGDLDFDGDVDLSDLGILLAAFGNACM
jgi:hypothetical protein